MRLESFSVRTSYWQCDPLLILLLSIATAFSGCKQDSSHPASEKASSTAPAISQNDGAGERTGHATSNRVTIYDETADAQALVDAAVIRAKSSHKHVLVMYGGNWCSWCVRLHGVFKSDPAIRDALQNSYELVMVDARKNPQVAERYHASINGYPYLTVLGQDAAVLVNQPTDPFESGPTYENGRIFRFLKQFAPAPVNTAPLG